MTPTPKTSSLPRPEPARLAANGMVCTVDHVASAAGAHVLAEGGNAADAAVAASAVLAVTTQYMCGMGGDLWAIVHTGDGPPAVLNASGRAGSGSDPDQLRAEGHQAMPYRGDLRSTPVPGCVDGWIALHERFGRLDLEAVLAPARRAAEAGFAVAPLLAKAIPTVADVAGNQDFFPDGSPAKAGQRIHRPGLARALADIVGQGRAGWYEGEFGQALIEAGNGIYHQTDLERSCADWVEPVRAEAWDSVLWTAPPNSQGYLSLAGAVIAQGLADLPDDPSDPLWAHLLIESAKQAGYDRRAELHEGADGNRLASEEHLAARRARISSNSVAPLAPPAAGGGTIYLCTADSDRMGVSLIQSNAAGFGANVALPSLGVFLHNRGIGFSLEPGHPAELGPGRRPPSTLSPALITNRDGSLHTVLGTMGGDGQPQVILQMMAHLLQADSGPSTAISHPRFTLTMPDGGGFDTWEDPDRLQVAVESGSSWADGLAALGHRVDVRPWGEGLFGHAHLIRVGDDHLAGVAEPRVRSGAAVGL